MNILKQCTNFPSQPGKFINTFKFNCFELFVLVLFFMSCIPVLSAEDMLNFGVTGGSNRYSNRSDNTKFKWDTNGYYSPNKINDDDFSYFAGIVAEIKPFQNENSFLLKITFNDYEFKSILYQYLPIYFENEKGEPVLAGPVSYVYDYNLKSIAADIMYKLSLWKGLNVTAGFSANSFITTDIKATLNLLTDAEIKFPPNPDYKYENNNRTLVFVDNTEIEGFNKFQFTGSIGARYDIPVSDFKFSPFITYNYFFTKFLQQQNWRMTTFSGGLDIIFKI